MKRLTFSAKPELDTALLIKGSLVFNTPEQKQVFANNYFVEIGRHLEEKINKRVVVCGTYHPETGKVKKKDIVTFSEEILDYCVTMGIENLLVADGEYFKYLSGCKVFEKHIGEKFECIVSSYGELTITPVLNYTSVNMFPEKQPIQDKAIKTAANIMSGTYTDKVEFTFNDYRAVINPDDLSELLRHPTLAIDIETTGLRFERDTMLSISFAWSDKDAISIPIHRRFHDEETELEWLKTLKEFFLHYRGTKVFHNALFDVKFLVRELFMTSDTDYEGRTIGTNALDCDDTMIMAYLCLNSTSRPSLSLKDLIYEYVGEYAVNVKNLTEALDAGIITEDELLLYNAKDTVGTFWLFEKYSDLIIKEEQLNTYNSIMKPSLNYLTQMMLNGLPLDKNRVETARDKVQGEFDTAVAQLNDSIFTQHAVRQLRMEAADKYNDSHKVKQKTQGDFMDMKFNPNSPKQLATLIFTIMEYEPIDYTPTGQPKTNRASIEEFLESETEPLKRTALEALVAISQTGIILTTFLDTFTTLWHNSGSGSLGLLYGNQRLGGTQTGRLSSNSPNFANMPSGSTYGKTIKSCFVAPEGWLFFGSDYGALEDRVGAEITNDRNKKAEFLQGFDGHSLRAYAFFKEEIDEALGEELDPTDPASINRIKDELPEIRAKSKSPSFAMAYGSGAGKVKDLLKCTKAEAEAVFEGYHKLYRDTAIYAERNIEKAKAQGYINGAFGLKLRTPGIRSRDRIKVGSEGRSLNNMTIQSYGLLMNRAGIGFQKAIEDDNMINDVLLINQIHDALYGLVRNTPENVKWLNDNLIECMVEDYVPDQEIKLEAELDLGPSWDVQTTIKNNLSLQEIKEALENI